MTGYDFDDFLIRDMVRVNHLPTEQVVTSAEGVAIVNVQCQQCVQTWPCPTITAYRQWEAAQPTEGPTPA